MHEFIDAGMFAFETTDDLAGHLLAHPHEDDTGAPYEVDDPAIVDPVGPHTAESTDTDLGNRSGNGKPSTPEHDSVTASPDSPILTGNPALDIDLSDADPALDDPTLDDPTLDNSTHGGPSVDGPAPDTDTAAAERQSTASDTADETGVHGNAVQWTIDWFYQQVDGYCGPAVVGQLVAEYTGANITDPQHLVDRAVELGLMSADDPAAGMTLPDIERLLEDQGVPASISSGSLDDLRTQLDDGHAVIAMVDSGEIWQPSREAVEDNTPDHVLVVAGIDDDRGVVILSDPGVPNGSQLEIPIEQFEQAWADSGHQMLVADQPDPDLTPTTPPTQTQTQPTSGADDPATAASASPGAAEPTPPMTSAATRTTVISLRS